MVVLPIGGILLVLEDGEFEAALERGRGLMPVPFPTSSAACEIVDAAGAEAATGVPASWWLEAARRGDIPCLAFGKYRRFNLAEVIKAARCR